MKQIDRSKCIDEVRSALLQLVDEDHSMCEVAARRGIFCKGFAQWSFDELKRRYAWIASHRPHVTREQLEHLANGWQLARQQVFGTCLSCDTETGEHDTCRGFDQFSDAELASYHAALCGEPVEIVPAK